MTTEHAAILANLTALRTAARVALDAVNRASQGGTLEDWKAARAAATPACKAASDEESRIVRAGFGGDDDFEFAVLGRLQRRHTDPCVVRWDDLRV